MKAASFEDLKVWQDSREFVKSIYEITASDNFKKDYGFNWKKNLLTNEVKLVLVNIFIGH